MQVYEVSQMNHFVQRLTRQALKIAITVIITELPILDPKKILNVKQEYSLCFIYKLFLHCCSEMK